MNIFHCFVFVSLVIFVQADLKTRLCNNNDTIRTDAFAAAIVTALEKLSTRSSPLINIFYNYRVATCQQEFIFEKVMERKQSKFLVQTFNHTPFQISFMNSTLAKDPQTTLAIQYCHPTGGYSKPLLFYCPDNSIDEIRKIVGQDYSNEHPSGRNNKFLVESEKKFIDLWSIVHFTANKSSCRKSQLVRTNRFLINESRWLTNEFLTEPQRNFHGCEFRVTVEHREPYTYYTQRENGTIDAGGIYVEMLKLAASSFNFSLHFIGLGAKKKQKYNNWNNDVRFYNGYSKEHSTQYLIYINYIFLVPPGELYSDAAKLFMPLKFEVWIATVVTISIALLTIQIINRMSQQVQDFVYGRNVMNPTLNIMIAFVGGAQSTLPGRNFARFLLMLFIFFSLIIRTCHQSKLFTYLQADIIKREIQSIDELIEQNGLIYIPDHYFGTASSFQRFEKIIRYDSKNPKKFFEKTLESGFEGAVMTNLSFLIELESRFKSGKTSLNPLKESEYGYFVYYPHHQDNFLKEQIDEVIRNLHSAGLTDLWYVPKYGSKPQEESGPTPLMMDHLAAGFVVSTRIHVS